jgi:glycosyl transferase family 25
VRAYVINLARSDDRRRHISAQLDASGIDYEFVPAVDGAALSQADRESLVHPSIRGAPQWLSAPGVVGCALSHLDAYRRIVASGDRVAAVFEDDVVVNERTRAVMDELEPHVEDGDLVLLHFRSFAPCKFGRAGAVRLSMGLSLAPPLDPAAPVASAAYVISRSTAERLAAAVLPVHVSADSWAHYCSIGAIGRLRCVVPPPVAIAPDFSTTLGYPLGNATLGRIAGIVSARRLPPFHQILTHIRRRRLRDWSAIEWVDDDRSAC